MRHHLALFGAAIIVRAVFVVAVVLAIRYKSPRELSRHIGNIWFGANQMLGLYAELRKPRGCSRKDVVIDHPSSEIEMRFTLQYVLDVINRYSYSLSDSCPWTNYGGQFSRLWLGQQSQNPSVIRTAMAER